MFATAGLGRVPATAAGIVALLEPLTATTLGLLVFGERLGPVGIARALRCSWPPSPSSPAPVQAASDAADVARRYTRIGVLHVLELAHAQVLDGQVGLQAAPGPAR